MVLLLYSHAVHTSMSILRCPLITDKTGDAKPVTNVTSTYIIRVQLLVIIYRDGL